MQGVGNPKPGRRLEVGHARVGRVPLEEHAGGRADGCHDPSPNNGHQDGVKLKGPVAVPQILAAENDEDDGQSANGPMPTCFRGAELKQRQPDERDGWRDGNGTHETKHFAYEAAGAHQNLNEGTCNDGALHVLHAYFPTGFA